MVYESAVDAVQFHAGPLGSGVTSLAFDGNSMQHLGCSPMLPEGSTSLTSHPTIAFIEDMKEFNVSVLPRDQAMGDTADSKPVYDAHFTLGSQKSLSLDAQADSVKTPWHAVCPDRGRSRLYDVIIKGTTARGTPLESHSIFSAVRDSNVARTGMPSRCLEPNPTRALPIPPMLPLDPNDLLPFNYIGLDML